LFDTDIVLQTRVKFAHYLHQGSSSIFASRLCHGKLTSCIVGEKRWGLAGCPHDARDKIVKVSVNVMVILPKYTFNFI